MPSSCLPNHASSLPLDFFLISLFFSPSTYMKHYFLLLSYLPSHSHILTSLPPHLLYIITSPPPLLYPNIHRQFVAAFCLPAMPVHAVPTFLPGGKATPYSPHPFYYLPVQEEITCQFACRGWCDQVTDCGLGLAAFPPLTRFVGLVLPATHLLPPPYLPATRRFFTPEPT